MELYYIIRGAKEKIENVRQTIIKRKTRTLEKRIFYIQH